ncbi:MAG: hypothetical protein ABJP34_05945 [Erythrobacter sp.]
MFATTKQIEVFQMEIDYRATLEVLSAWAAILTAVVATGAYARFICERNERTKLLENYLREEKLSGIDQGQRTVIHLMAELGLSEQEIFTAAFRTKKVRALTSVDNRGHASKLLFEYCGDDIPMPKKH